MTIRLALGVAVAAFCCDSAVAQFAADRGWSRISQLQPSGEPDVKLAIMSYDDDRIAAYETVLPDTNILRSRSFTDSSTKGATSNRPIPKADADRLDELLGELPPENPPTQLERRVIFNVRRAAGREVRTYDRAHLPERILEIGRIVGGIGSWIRRVEPQAVAQAHRSGAPGCGALVLMPDGKQFLSVRDYEASQVWDVERREVREVKQEGSSLTAGDVCFSPDGKRMMLREGDRVIIMDPATWHIVTSWKTKGWEGHRPARFSADGKLLLFAGTKGLNVYDATGWMELPGVPDMPAGLTHYAATSDGRWAVVGRQDGALELWDVPTKTMRAELDTGCYPRFIEFSPDQLRVAIISEHRPVPHEWNYSHIRIYDLNTAKLVREFRPFDVVQIRFDSMVALRWTSDGKYLLSMGAADFTGHGVHVWDVATGRHRLDFVGCTTNITGLELTPDDRTLIVGTCDGKIRFWDFAQGLKDAASDTSATPR